MFSTKLLSKKTKKTLKTLFFLFLLSLILGLIILLKGNTIELLEQIKNIEEYLKINSINYLTFHLLVIILLVISKYCKLIKIVIPLLISWECFCMPYLFYPLTKIYGLKGFIYSIFYLLITKGIYLLCLIIIYFRKNIKEDHKKRLQNKAELIILGYDIFLYFFGSFILAKLLFIIK